MKKIFIVLLAVAGCHEKPGQVAVEEHPHKQAISCESNIPARFAVPPAGAAAQGGLPHAGAASHPGMVWIEGGTFQMGADNGQASEDEYPKHQVTVSGFWMDKTEVTNAQFAAFVQATGYITTAEKKPDWDQLKKQLPPGTPKPDENLLVAAALVFTPPDHPIALDDYSQWWAWKKGANWRHPQGPGSDLKGKQHYPVVQVSWYDAVAYCKWAGKRLPTEAEWEYAGRGGLAGAVYPWGNEPVENGTTGGGKPKSQPRGNFWEGHFPDKNMAGSRDDIGRGGAIARQGDAASDNFYGAAPVGSFQPNGYGLFDMAGNVWEWCADYYNNKYYSRTNRPSGVRNPPGPDTAFDPDEPYAMKRVVRGGSFLCNESYCTGYRVSRRMKSTEDSGMEHVGFRCVSER